MDLRSRRILYSGAIALFCVVAPLLLLYAQGYRFDISHRVIVKTGSLALTTTPTGTTVTLDGRIQPGSTPQLIESLLPGRYSIALSKQGFKTVETTTVIESRNTSSIDAVLLPESPLRATVDIPLSLIDVHPSPRDSALWLTGRTDAGISLSTTDRSFSKVTTVAQFKNVPDDTPLVSWSSRSRYAAISWAEGPCYLWDTQSNTLAYSSPGVQLLQWDDESESIAYLYLEDTWWRLDLFNGSARVIVTGPNILLRSHANDIVTVRPHNDGSLVQRFDTRGLTEVRSSRFSVGYTVTSISSFGQYLALSNDHEVRIVRNEGTTVAQYPISGVMRLSESADGRTLLIQTRDELWIVNDLLVQPTLLIRASEIIDVEWYAEYRTVIVLHGDTLEAFSMVQPDIRPGILGQIKDGSFLTRGTQQELFAAAGRQLYRFDIFP